MKIELTQKQIDILYELIKQEEILIVKEWKNKKLRKKFGTEEMKVRDLSFEKELEEIKGKLETDDDFFLQEEKEK